MRAHRGSRPQVFPSVLRNVDRISPTPQVGPQLGARHWPGCRSLRPKIPAIRGDRGRPPATVLETQFHFGSTESPPTRVLRKIVHFPNYVECYPRRIGIELDPGGRPPASSQCPTPSGAPLPLDRNRPFPKR